MMPPASSSSDSTSESQPASSSLIDLDGLTQSSNAYGGSGTTEGRDSWCTPKWLADLLGRFDIDPCSNERSHIQAVTQLVRENGDDGLCGGYSEYAHNGDHRLADEDDDVFINPPYARGAVLQWVRHWCTQREFVFLLRWDPSTAWFSELIHHCTHVWFPDVRINFEPPPGVKSSSNPFPHALYIRRRAKRTPSPLLTRLSTRGHCLTVNPTGSRTRMITSRC